MTKLLGQKGEELSAEEFWSKLAPNRYTAVWYADDRVWHCRLLLRAGPDGQYAIATPDDDVYLENVLAEDPDSGPARCHLLVGRTRPATARPGEFYNFKMSPSGRRLAKLRKDADALLGTLALLPVVGTPASTDGMWVVIDPELDNFGHEVDASEVQRGAGLYASSRAGLPLKFVKTDGIASLRQRVVAALAPEGGLATPQGEDLGDVIDQRLAAPPADETKGDDDKGGDEDLRTLWIDFDAHHERHKPWRSVCQECDDSGARHWGAHHEGPPATLELLKSFEKQGGDPRLWYQSWCRDNNVSSKERTGIELKVLTECLYLGGCFDQLNLASLASMEIIARRVCQLVEAYFCGEPGRPSWDGVRYLAPSLFQSTVVPNALRVYASRRLKEEADLENRSRSRPGGGGGARGAFGDEAADALAGGAPGSPAKPKKGDGKGGKAARRLTAEGES